MCFALKDVKVTTQSETTKEAQQASRTVETNGPKEASQMHPPRSAEQATYAKAQRRSIKQAVPSSDGRRRRSCMEAGEAKHAAKQSKAKQSKAKQSKAEQSRAEQSNATQRNAKQSKAKQVRASEQASKRASEQASKQASKQAASNQASKQASS